MTEWRCSERGELLELPSLSFWISHHELLTSVLIQPASYAAFAECSHLRRAKRTDAQEVPLSTARACWSTCRTFFFFFFLIALHILNFSWKCSLKGPECRNLVACPSSHPLLFSPLVLGLSALGYCRNIVVHNGRLGGHAPSADMKDSIWGIETKKLKFQVIIS